MVRATLRVILGRILKLFFRRIELSGLERIPPTGPVLFATNHPNALVDPLFLLCFVPRPVSFLAKAPLFRMPVIGSLARALDAIPVYRQQDPGTRMANNRETFSRARALLERGGTIAIAPEGTSHSHPRLRPLKTGAARIALGAGTREPVRIVPVGLFYTGKETFRSEALVYFGPPLEVAAGHLTPEGEPVTEEVDRVTALIERALGQAVIQADEHAALELAARAERLLSAGVPGATAPSLAEVLTMRRRLVAGYGRLRETAPEELESLGQRLERLESEFRTAAIAPEARLPARFQARDVAIGVGLFTLRLILFLPLALPGLVLHYPAYWLIGRLARRAAKGHDDVLATAKIIGGLIFFPLTWVALAILAGRSLGWPGGLAALALAPLSGYAALRLVERFDRFLSLTRAFGFYLFERASYGELARGREAFRLELAQVAERLGV